MVSSKEGGESSLTYGTSDGKSTASPESLMWWTTEEGAYNKSRPVRQRENASLYPGSLRWEVQDHTICLQNPEYVCEQDGFTVRIVKPQVSP